MEHSIQQIFEMEDKMEKQEKIERFRRLNAYVKPGQILFVGSSLMEQFPIYEFCRILTCPTRFTTSVRPRVTGCGT